MHLVLPDYVKYNSSRPMIQSVNSSGKFKSFCTFYLPEGAFYFPALMVAVKEEL